MIFNDSKFNQHWPIKTLNELGTFRRGKSKHRPRNDKKLFVDGRFPLIQTGEIKSANISIDDHSICYNDFGLSQSKLWPEGTLCITIAANIAETAILGYPMCFPDSVVGFNAYPEECSEVYMHYIFSYIRSSIQNRIRGSIQDNINIDYLTGLSFRIPEKYEREKIESLLFSFDSKIELNNKINAELEGMAKLIYEYWFVQFDFPFDFASTALSTGAQGKPSDDSSDPKDVKPYKSSGGKMVWNKELKREIPEGWEVKELKDIASITMGQSPPGESYNENSEGTVFYQGCTDFGNRFPTIRKFTTMPTRFANEGDLLLSVRAPVGAINISKEHCCIGRGLAALAAKNGQKTFLFGVMQNLKQIFDRRNVDGTTFGAITKDDLFTIKVVRPEKSILDHFHKLTITSFNKQNKCELENIQLSSLRDWLLPMLMNGQVRVKDQ